jgi:hypothetical protein
MSDTRVRKMTIKYGVDCSRRWALMRWLDVPSKTNPSDVYLRRLRIFNTPWCSLYIHWIYEPDTDRYPHDHPWDFWSLILNGSYTEEIHDFPGSVPTMSTWRRGQLHKMSITKAHRITRTIGPLVTLVITGRRRREWCFWTDTEMIPYTSYLRATGELDPW